jgi:hypothetical protein
MTMTPTDEAVEAIAASQRGRFTRAQVRGCGEDGSWMISSRIRSGRWRRLSSRVLCLPGAPRDWLGEIWTARLHVGDDTVVSHRSAARLHAFPGVPRSTPCLTVPAGSNRRYAAGRLYQRGDLAPGQVVRIDGLIVTSAARTLVDLAPGVSRSRLEIWLDHTTAERLATPDELVAVVRLCGRPGKPSLKKLGELLEEYLPGSGSAQGTLERALGNVIRLAGLPPGVAQFEHPGATGCEEFCDRAWLQPRLIVECDGRKWHDRITAARIDKRRDTSAAAEGWQTIRYGYEELVRHPKATAEELRAIYERRMVGPYSESDSAALPRVSAHGSLVD